MTVQVPSPVLPKQANLRVTTSRVLLSEWTKIRSIRSTSYTLLAAVVLMVGLGVLICAVTAHEHIDLPAGSDPFNAAGASVTGIVVAQLAIGILGVLLISGEYSTGMIRASLTAVPSRLLVLWGKLGVFAAVTFVVALIAALVSFFLGQALLSSQHLDVSLASPGALRIVVGAALYLTVAGVIGLCLGTLWRNTAAGISTFVALFFLLPLISSFLPTSLSAHITPYLPSSAGGAVTSSINESAGWLSPWAGFALFCGYAVVLALAAAWRLKRTDA